MLSQADARKIALSFLNVEELPHFDRPSFRIKNKIFATLNTKKSEMVLKFTPIEQDIFLKFDASAFYPVPGAWGQKGWTIMNLNKINTDTATDALKTAYSLVAPKSGNI